MLIKSLNSLWIKQIASDISISHLEIHIVQKMVGSFENQPFLSHIIVNRNMKWIRLFNESSEGGEKQVIPVELTTREVMLIQNYLNKGKSLNDP